MCARAKQDNATHELQPMFFSTFNNMFLRLFVTYFAQMQIVRDFLPAESVYVNRTPTALVLKIKRHNRRIPCNIIACIA